MREMPPLTARALVACVLVVLLAAATRVGYLAVGCDYGHGAPRLVVQGDGLRSDRPASSCDGLVRNLREHRWYGSKAPLADTEGLTAHVAPGYPWLAALVPSDTDLRRLQ